MRARTRVDGAAVEPVCAHPKAKLLTFPGNRFTPRDEDERDRVAVYALGRRAAEAATVRGLVTRPLHGQNQQRPRVVLGDFNDTEDSATTPLLYGPGGSEIGTGGFRPARPEHHRRAR
jgi:hypothetical protein